MSDETCGSCRWGRPISGADIGRHDLPPELALVECHGAPCSATYPTQRVSVYGICQATDMACAVWAAKAAIQSEEG